jgi:hypothetical protein
MTSSNLLNKCYHEADGAVVLFDKDVYTPQELWENSQAQINLVSGVKSRQ